MVSSQKLSDIFPLEKIYHSKRKIANYFINLTV